MPLLSASYQMSRQVKEEAFSSEKQTQDVRNILQISWHRINANKTIDETAKDNKIFPRTSENHKQNLSNIPEKARGYI